MKSRENVVDEYSKGRHGGHIAICIPCQKWINILNNLSMLGFQTCRFSRDLRRMKGRRTLIESRASEYLTRKKMCQAFNSRVDDTVGLPLWFGTFSCEMLQVLSYVTSVGHTRSLSIFQEHSEGYDIQDMAPKFEELIKHERDLWVHDTPKKTF